MTRHHVVLYNVQRLLALGGSPVARALDATAAHGWTPEAYETKVARIGAVLRDATGGIAPAVLVLIEVEDAQAVNDVIVAAGWPQMTVIVPAAEQVDGWDVAIAFEPSAFPGGLTDAESHVFSNRFGTRDLLIGRLATGAGQDLVVMATHWPSRKISSSGAQRYAAAAYCDNILEGTLKFRKQDLLTETGQPRIPSITELLERWQTPVLIAGDFNDEPWDDSVRALGSATAVARAVTAPPRMPSGSTLKSVGNYLSRRVRVFNPTWNLAQDNGAPATYYYGSEWHRIDQMLVSSGMLTGGAPRYVDGSLRIHQPRSVEVDGAPVEVTSPTGVPRRFDMKTMSGVSDHLPLVAEIDV